MVATFPSRSKTDFSSLNLYFALPAASWSVESDLEIDQAEVGTWDTYLQTLDRAIVEAEAARKIAQRDYKKVQAEADRWERLQLALSDDREDLVSEALWQKNACRDKAHQLKVLVEQHSVRVSTLRSQIAYWANQI
jgi:phage shock protein A